MSPPCPGRRRLWGRHIIRGRTCTHVGGIEEVFTLNPYRIYRDEWARALRIQTTAKAYQTFVAMPFRDRFRYRSRQVLDNTIRRAATVANERSVDGLRAFSTPERVDRPAGAVLITDEIVQGIVESHFFIADLTFENPGVILEAGIAFGAKPNRQIILITQGNRKRLHFDLRNNNVIRYRRTGSVEEIAGAFISAARAFESRARDHIVAATSRVSPDAIACLKWYAQRRKIDRHASLHDQDLKPQFPGNTGLIRFNTATQELRERDLLWTDYSVAVPPMGRDAFGMHATEFGWAVIEYMWPDLRTAAGE